MSFNCDFNAPQFFDFEKMAEGKEDNSLVENYFAYDHENGGHKVESEPEDFDKNDVSKVADEKENVEMSDHQMTESNSSSTTNNLDTNNEESVKSANGSLLAKMMRRQATPKKRLESVQKTIESANNSPKIEVNLKREKGGQMTKESLNKWKKIMTPDILKKARSKGLGSKPVIGDSSNCSRLANASTLTSKIRKEEVLAKMANKDKNEATSVKSDIKHRVTNPVPFKFSSRNETKKHEPVKVKADDIDFSKMLRNYGAKGDDEQPKKCLAIDRPSRRRSSSVSSGSRRRSPSPSIPFSFVERDLQKIKEKVEAQKKASESCNFPQMLRSYPDKEKSVYDTGNTKFKPFSFDSRPSKPRAARSSSAEPSPSRLRKVSESSRGIIRKKSSFHHSGVPTKVSDQQKSRISNTIVQPFSFESRDREMLQKKQEKINKIIEQEKLDHEFKANPMPNLAKPSLVPSKSSITPTEPKPFNLEIEKRVEERIEKWRKEVEDKDRQVREATNFKAQPADVLKKDPFQPEKSDRRQVEPLNIELHSDKRAREREAYEKNLKEREAQLEKERQELHNRRQEEEDLELKRLRKEITHKAQPVKRFNPVKILHSQKPLTCPISPNFSKRK